MKNLLCALILSFLVVGAVHAADHQVVVPRDATSFKVDQKSLVRLTGKGIAGSTISAKVVSGKAKIAATNHISYREGGHVVIGVSVVEFDVKSGGKGKVKVEVTVKPPQPGAKAEVKVYEFEVE